MRADRLVAALLVLQSRGRVTASELAEELEVSVATARRDLEALSAAGIPVYPQVGRNGGWALLGGARTDLTGLTSAEAQALFAIVGPATEVAPEAKAALRKLLQALPDPFRADAAAAADAVVIDPTTWGRADRERPPLVDLLQSAVVARRRVRLTYAGWDRAATERVVDPWGLVDKDDRWYLVAGTEAGQRTFRLDRISDAVVTDEPADRPDDLELATVWAGVVDEVERQRSRTTAAVLVDAEVVSWLRSSFGRHCRVGDATGDGRVRMEVAAPTATLLARQLAGWGAAVELIGDGPVREELVRITAELATRYAT
jgi:predicted DNA-binding transcriptional regulator YafY